MKLKTDCAWAIKESLQNVWSPILKQPSAIRLAKDPDEPTWHHLTLEFNR
jgi:hypothetical protein